MSPFRFFASYLTASAIGLMVVVPAESFSRISIGSVVDNAEMLTLEGLAHPLLGTEPANIILFFRPDQERSREVLKDVALLEQELAEKPVSWVTIVSDRYSKEEVQAVVDEAGLEGPVLIDEDDAVSGKLGVHIHPVVGVTDPDHVLKAYQHYRKINFINSLRACILHQLGELSDAELEQTLNPPQIDLDSRSSVAKRNLKLAEMLFEAGNLPKALERAKKSLEYDPAQAEAHALVGAILAAQGDCPSAILAFELALILDPNEPTAMEGKKTCQGGS